MFRLPVCVGLTSQETLWGKCLCSVVEGNGWDGWRDAFCLFAQLLYCWTTFEWNLFLLQEILLDGKPPFYSTTQSVGCVHVCAYGGGGIWEKLPGRQSWRFSAFCQAKESLTFVGFSLLKIVSNFSGKNIYWVENGLDVGRVGGSVCSGCVPDTSGQAVACPGTHHTKYNFNLKDTKDSKCNVDKECSCVNQFLCNWSQDAIWGEVTFTQLRFISVPFCCTILLLNSFYTSYTQ